MTRAENLEILGSRSYSAHARLMAAYRLLVAEYVDDDLVNEYRVKLTQTSTGAPTVAAVLKNEVGTIVWGYTSAGVYTGTLAGAFANGIKTTGGVIDSDTEDEWSVVRTSADVITLTTSRAGTPTNGLMTACSIDIDVIV